MYTRLVERIKLIVLRLIGANYWFNCFRSLDQVEGSSDDCHNSQKAEVTGQEGDTTRGISQGEEHPDTPIPTLCSEINTSAFNYFFHLSLYPYLFLY